MLCLSLLVLDDFAQPFFQLLSPINDILPLFGSDPWLVSLKTLSLSYDLPNRFLGTLHSLFETLMKLFLSGEFVKV